MQIVKKIGLIILIICSAIISIGCILAAYVLHPDAYILGDVYGKLPDDVPTKVLTSVGGFFIFMTLLAISNKKTA